MRDDSAPVAAHGMSSMDFAIADDSDDAQHLVDDEEQGFATGVRCLLSFRIARLNLNPTP